MAGEREDAGGRVEAIHIAAAAGASMQARDRAEALTGSGLVGDRYTGHTGHWSAIRRRGDGLTLMEAEVLDALNADYGFALAPGDPRRNVTTRGIRLDPLIGHRFRIGPVVCEAVRRCEPCSYLEGLLGKEVLYPFVHRAGIRVEILEGGWFGIGDPIEPIEA